MLCSVMTVILKGERGDVQLFPEPLPRRLLCMLELTSRQVIGKILQIIPTIIADQQEWDLLEL